MEFVQNNLLYVALAAISGGMLLWQTFNGRSGNQISPAEATLMMNREDAVVIDVRDSAEWATGHIQNARHIPAGQLGKRLPELDKFKSRNLIVICHAGHRSLSACGVLQKHGFEKVFNLHGGITAWREAGLPLTTK